MSKQIFNKAKKIPEQNFFLYPDNGIFVIVMLTLAWRYDSWKTRIASPNERKIYRKEQYLRVVSVCVSESRLNKIVTLSQLVSKREQP